MAMYYQSSSEIQADGLHTLYLMNPNYVAYSDSDSHTTQPNMLFLNPSSAAAVMPHAPLHHGQQFMGIPLSHDPSRPLPPAALPQQQDIAAQTPIPRLHYYTWGSVDPNLPQQTPRGLSLSLAAHHQEGFDSEFPTGQSPAGVGIILPKNCSPPPSESNSVIMGSKYLKAAQELLDQVVNVGKEAVKDKAKLVERDKTAAIHIEAAIKTELTAAQRQEIQMKKSKLNSMLDEVEKRCRQYQQQMQIVVAAFEQAAGRGSGRAYTHLALKTISKQFRCLKSTISAQIKELSKRLGEEESLDHSKKLEGSRLKYVDAQIRQQMMQSNAWRPQRGLPERAVSVLRAWLFEHFLHPYPKDSDKQLLAKQTGLTRGQVSNWFINARVRLWKPMVEEMYLEETKNQPDASIKPATAAASPPPPPEISASTLTTASPPGSSLPTRTNFAQLISSLNMDSLQQQKNPKKPRNAINPSTDNQMDDITEAGDHSSIVKFSTENYLSMAAANVNRYGADQHLPGSHAHGNSFSLSLGLHPTESSQQQFLSHRDFEFGTRIESRVVEGGGGGGGGVRINEGGAASHHSNMGYEVLDFQNRKAFPAQLFPDFVA